MENPLALEALKINAQNSENGSLVPATPSHEKTPQGIGIENSILIAAAVAIVLGGAIRNKKP